MKNQQRIAGLALAVVIAVLNMAQSQEEIPPLPPEHAVRQAVIIRHQPPVYDMREVRGSSRRLKMMPIDWNPGAMMRITLPFPGELPEAGCSATASCEEMLNQTGCDFAHCSEPSGDVTMRFVRLGCPCAASGECHCASEAVCGSDCAAACKCCSCADQGVACGDEHCAMAVAHAERHAAPDKHHAVAFIEHIAHLIADQAAARAELESRRETSEKVAELYETIAELIAANAALEAKLEAQIEHTKMVEKFGELAAENARLKTHVELATSRSDATTQTISLTLENERLKLRLADLEQRHADSESARTAARPRSERKPR